MDKADGGAEAVVMARVELDTAEFREFFEKCAAAGTSDFKAEMALYLEGLGNEFLRIVEEEIIARKVMRTRNLLKSFHKGGNDNVFEMNEGNLTLEVGTNVTYAAYVNDGHWTCAKGEEKRFVPGYWKDDEFIYDPSASEGMVLKQKWVEGKHYWEASLKIMEKVLPNYLDEKLQQWLDNYFGG